METTKWAIHAEFIVLLFIIAGLFLWLRTESSEDRRLAISMIDAIHSDIKDFHGRLCIIEERNR